MSTTETPATVTCEVAAITEASTRKAIVDHITRYHRKPWNIRGNSTKANLLDFHDKVHSDAVYGNPHAEDGNKTWRDYFGFLIEHVHLDAPTADPSVPVLPEHEDLLKKMRAGQGVDKVLNATERNILTKLIENDFDTLASKIKAMANDIRQSRLAEVVAEYADREERAVKYRTQIEGVTRRATERVAAIRAAAASNGVEMSVSERYPHVNSLQAKGFREARDVVERECGNDLTRALSTLEQQKLSALRTVLLAGVSPEGKTLLDSIPSAQELMLTAASGAHAPQVEAAP